MGQFLEGRKKCEVRWLPGGRNFQRRTKMPNAEFDNIYVVGCPVQNLFSPCSYIIVKIYISLLMSCGFVYVFWKTIGAKCGP